MSAILPLLLIGAMLAAASFAWKRRGGRPIPARTARFLAIGLVAITIALLAVAHRLANG